MKNINEFTDYISRIKKSANLDDNFQNLGINIKGNLSKIISSVNIQRLSNNPIELNQNDLKDILLKK